ncbi:MAG: hypothetical protein HN350_10235 [Phycisphaerales bacterium]|jgi:adenylate kinase|nr:hypothetical protein [Phycisphaerales bacterium]
MQDALVLIGPTGSGKSPLGDIFAENGLWGRRCIHFDFGAELRKIADQTTAGDFTDTEIQFVRNVLETGALLEDGDFHLAMRAVQGVLNEKNAQNADENCILVMNGLPRHVGQARDLQAILEIRAVIVLNCSAQLVQSRITENTGGDRTNRADDDMGAVNKRLEIFAQRTAPLAGFYRKNGVAILTIDVAQGATPQKIADDLAGQNPL